MEEEHVSRSAFLIAILISLTALIVIFARSYFYSKTMVVFCDVGQGDGSYIRTQDHVDILIDAGPGNAVLNCLGKYMPFYDRTIELAFMSHPQQDHFGGFEMVLQRYQIKRFIATPVDNDTESFRKLKEELQRKKVEIVTMYAGDVVHTGKTASIDFLWPTKEYVVENTTAHPIAKASPTSQILGASTAQVDLNNFSEIFTFSDGPFDVLYTGDAPSEVFDFVDSRGLSFSKGLDVLKFPHHGSKTGLNPEFLKLADPTLSVISVAKKNRYGHPSPQVLDLLRALKKRYMMTSERGDIIVTIEKNGWTVRSSRQ